MLVRRPGGPRGQVRDDLVALTDVTATLLAAAGRAVPSYMGSQPLPGLGLRGESAREIVFGYLHNGTWATTSPAWTLTPVSWG